MRKRNIFALTIFVIFYISFGIYLSLNQEKIIYQPFAQDFESCAAFQDDKKVNYEETRMYASETEKPVVILYHGNAGSACDRDFYAKLFSQAGYGYLIVEYAGYSNDPRQPTHDLIKQDVKNVIAYLEENEIEDVTIVGESLGTGVTTYHTSLAPPKKLLLISPFTDLADAARQRFWFYPTSLLVDNAFDNVSNLKNYNGHVMILHGKKDNLAPYKLGNELFKTLETEKTLIPIPEAGHNDIFGHEETYQAIQKFLDTDRD